MSSLLSYLLSPCVSVHFVSGVLCLRRAARTSPPYFPRRPPSLHRLPSASVRRLLRYYEDATTAATAFVCVSFPSRATYCVPAVLCVSVISDSSPCSVPVTGRAVGLPVSAPPPVLSAESCGSPRFLYALLCLCPVLRPRRWDSA